jgi:hypothetical protein
MLVGAPRNALRAFNAGVSLSGKKILALALPRALYGNVLLAPSILDIVAHLPHSSFKPVLYPSAVCSAKRIVKEHFLRLCISRERLFSCIKGLSPRMHK